MPSFQYEYYPVTVERWRDLDRLFSASAGEELGNPSRCWCMEWRMDDHGEWERGAGERNRERMTAVVASGAVPGILAYERSAPVAWCSVSPRAELVGLHRAGSFRNPARPDVWSIVCFYVPESHRGRGLMAGLVAAARDYALAQGAAIVEGYPMMAEAGDDGAGGRPHAFESAGFSEVAQFGEFQRVMRYFAETNAR
jgi:GNAT superfamily N-acetyltransferase